MVRELRLLMCERFRIPSFVVVCPTVESESTDTAPHSRPTKAAGKRGYAEVLLIAGGLHVNALAVNDATDRQIGHIDIDPNQNTQ